jgi:hypothetical protein
MCDSMTSRIPENQWTVHFMNKINLIEQ